MAKNIKVSVLCLTYNQEKYIKQTLDSFLMQKTDFDFEVLINDDSSNDGTQKILKDYAEQHPDIIKPIFQKENLYSKGFRNFIPRFLLPKAKGTYIAICEGDDYWTDPNKLQTQVDFMDKHPDYALCFHAVKVVYENKEDKDFIFPDVKDKSWYTTQELLKTNYIPTNAVMYKKQKYKNIPLTVSPGDWFLHLYHAQFGKIKFIDKVMSVYRKHAGGIWWDYDKDTDAIWRKHGVAHLTMHDELLKLYGNDATDREAIEANIDRLLHAFIEVDKKYGEKLLKQAMTAFPDHGERLLLHMHQEVLTREKAINELWAAIHKQDEIIAHKDQQLSFIKASRFWKLRNTIAKLMGKKTI